MWWDIAPNMKSEFEGWHSHEHMPERLAIPGFLRDTRWIALSGRPSYFVLYEAAKLATITRGPYLERLNNPTPVAPRPQSGFHLPANHRHHLRACCSRWQIVRA